MAITPTYSWPLPDDTDLVKDGAEAIRDLGNAIDTTVGGLSSGGLVHIETFSPSVVSGQSINDIFSSTYDNYLITYNLVKSNSSKLQFRYRASGTDESSSVYDVSAKFSAITGAGNIVVASNQNIGTINENTQCNGHIFIYKPFLSTPTFLTGFGNFGDQGDQSGLITSTVAFTNSTSFDGISLICESGTMTGKISVFGYEK